ncbi:type I-C CRISPR-associated protein Cas5c [Streptomyces sp. MS19]|uniref:type I-C CRISPR-associated protein Cas5c n=1 Tax=Streptomyces sp. MS19 TaxID=3385972 RepID=UPI00399F1FAF
MFPDLVVETWGPLACFTRPELKTERVSYPVMTPSAAAGILEAIFWKPEFRYVVRSIEVLAPIAWTQMRRNEVKSTLNSGRVRELARNPALRYDVETDRDQRNTVALRDVAYRIHAQVEVVRGAAPEEKYREQLRRRVDRGACFSEPFFGCREFPAAFGPATGRPALTDLTEDLGVMLHSIRYTPEGERYVWFEAELKKGVMDTTRPLAIDASAPSRSPHRANTGED